MEQRRLRLGDILDDYCPRERRVTNHAVVAMIEEDRQADALHDLRRRAPLQGRSGAAPQEEGRPPPRSYKEVLAGKPDNDLPVHADADEADAAADLEAARCRGRSPQRSWRRRFCDDGDIEGVVSQPILSRPTIVARREGTPDPPAPHVAGATLPPAQSPARSPSARRSRRRSTRRRRGRSCASPVDSREACLVPKARRKSAGQPIHDPAARRARQPARQPVPWRQRSARSGVAGHAGNGGNNAMAPVIAATATGPTVALRRGTVRSGSRSGTGPGPGSRPRTGWRLPIATAAAPRRRRPEALAVVHSSTLLSSLRSLCLNALRMNGGIMSRVSCRRSRSCLFQRCRLFPIPPLDRSLPVRVSMLFGRLHSSRPSSSSRRRACRRSRCASRCCASSRATSSRRGRSRSRRLLRRAGRAWPGEVGPFSIEGATPDDTLVVKILRLRPNRDTAVSAVNPTGISAVAGDGRTRMLNDPLPARRFVWRLDRARNVGILDLPNSASKRSSCRSSRCSDASPWRRRAKKRGAGCGPATSAATWTPPTSREGTTVYLPIFHDGALLLLRRRARAAGRRRDLSAPGSRRRWT